MDTERKMINEKNETIDGVNSNGIFNVFVGCSGP